MASEADVTKICLSLPEVAETPYEHLPAFRVRVLARLRKDPDALVVWTADATEKEALIRSGPEKLFTTPLYDGHPAVLVRVKAAVVVVALFLAGCGGAATPTVTTVRTTGARTEPTSSPSPVPDVAPPTRAPAERVHVPARLVGTWVQDETGPVLTYRRVFRLEADGRYGFMVTSRNTGSVEETIVAQEDGTFVARGKRLKFSPRFGEPRTFRWRIETDPYVGDTRLVLVLPDGTLDVYYRP